MYSKKKIDWRWNMPDHNFTFTKAFTGASQTIQFVFIDTHRLQASTKASHLAWIISTLKASTAKFLIVVGYYQSKLNINKYTY